MIGNDIIDLKIAFQNERWKTCRFQEKLFSNNERFIISNSSSPQLMLWLLWSMKESAYKANQRMFNLERQFNPKSIECILYKINNEHAKGIVTIGEYYYECSSCIDSEKIHSIASADENITYDSQVLESNAIEMKNEFFHQISISKNIKKEKLRLMYNEQRVPQLYARSKKTEIPFSFSHHGRYSAYTFGLAN